MVLSALGGGNAKPCAGAFAGQRRAASVLAAFLRAGPNVLRQRSYFHRNGHRNLPTDQAYTLASNAVVSGHDVRAGDLNDMCTLQLGMLFQLLSRAGNNYSTMRCTVYARNFTSVGPGQVKLVRVAQFPVTSDPLEELPAQQQLLLHTEQSWALQGGSAAVDPCAMIEDCLLQREVVALPSSSSLVFPLVDQQVLVGLLVVELEADRAVRGPAEPLGLGQQPQQQQQQLQPEQWWQSQQAQARAETGSADTGPSGSDPIAPHHSAAAEWANELGRGAATGSRMAVGNDDGDAGAAGLASLERSPCPVHSHRHRSLSDDELQCLRLAVPLLAKACGMDARASWQLAQSSVSAAAAQGLLREVQRPLSTLNTFGAMLIPRLKDGDPDKDMAKAIVVQGKRLQDLMWQLEDALHGAAVPGSGAASGAVLGGAVPPPPSSSFGRSGGGMVAQSPQFTAPPFRSPTALPRDPSPAVQELLSLPPPRSAKALSAASQPHPQSHHQPQQQQQHPALHGPHPQGFNSEAAGPLDASPVEELLQYRGADVGAGPSEVESGPPRFTAGAVSPGRVTFVDRSSEATVSGMAGGGGGGGGGPPPPPPSEPAAAKSAAAQPFTIRQPPAVAGSPGGPGGRSWVSPHSTRGGAGGAATATIDVEMVCGEGSGRKGGAARRSAERLLHNGSGGGGSSAPWGWATASGAGGGGGGLAAAVSTNLASALAGVLNAAQRLAAVSGIGLIVNTPLAAVLPRRTSGFTGGGKARGHSNTAAARVGQGARAAPRQLPGPGSTGAHGDTGSAAAGTAVALPSDDMLASTGPLAGPRLIPRPARPLLVGVSAALLQKVVGYMLDIALQCTPRGGQVCVSARQDGAGVQLQVLHSGRMDLQRLHARSRPQLHPATTTTTTTGTGASSGTQQQLAAAGASSRGYIGGATSRHGGAGHAGTAVAVATRSPAAAPASPPPAPAPALTQAGSGVLSVEMAQELAHQAGGHLTVSYPFNMVNAQSGSLDVGTSVEIWLPGPGGALN